MGRQENTLPAELGQTLLIYGDYLERDPYPEFGWSTTQGLLFFTVEKPLAENGSNTPPNVYMERWKDGHKIMVTATDNGTRKVLLDYLGEDSMGSQYLMVNLVETVSGEDYELNYDRLHLFKINSSGAVNLLDRPTEPLTYSNDFRRYFLNGDQILRYSRSRADYSHQLELFDGNFQFLYSLPMEIPKSFWIYNFSLRENQLAYHAVPMEEPALLEFNTDQESIVTNTNFIGILDIEKGTSHRFPVQADINDSVYLGESLYFLLNEYHSIEIDSQKVWRVNYRIDEYDLSLGDLEKVTAWELNEPGESGEHLNTYFDTPDGLFMGFEELGGLYFFPRSEGIPLKVASGDWFNLLFEEEGRLYLVKRIQDIGFFVEMISVNR